MNSIKQAIKSSWLKNSIITASVYTGVIGVGTGAALVLHRGLCELNRDHDLEQKNT